MNDDDIPVTNAVRFLREKEIPFVAHKYRYEKEDITEVAARAVGVEEHIVVKTLVMQDDRGNPLIALMHGDKQVSAKKLARAIGAKNVVSASPREAERFTGYKVGGISPFGIRRSIPVYVEESILTLPRLFINGGRRGLLLEMQPESLLKAIPFRAVNVST